MSQCRTVTDVLTHDTVVMFGRFKVRPDTEAGQYGVWDGASGGSHGPRDAATVRRLEAPQEVDIAAGEPGGLLDAWVFNRRDGEWTGRVRSPDGTITWLRSTEVRFHPSPHRLTAWRRRCGFCRWRR
jgi:hypothetical protein